MQFGELTAEQQITALKQQLADAQRMAALGELVGTTTHEFNNVLMTILNYAKLGLRHPDPARFGRIDQGAARQAGSPFDATEGSARAFRAGLP